MTFEFKSGNLLHDDADALVNTVNCVGVMGKGIALSFKRAFPQNYKAYKDFCLKRHLKPGGIFVFNNPDLLNPEETKTIINFATKDHWRLPSKMEWILEGLTSLNQIIIENKIKSIAIPPLGCGNGGLEWKDVLPKILSHLDEASKNCVIHIYGQRIEEVYSDNLPEHATQTLQLSDGRALLLLSIGELESYFGGSITKLSAHKIFYFAQLFFGNLGVEFEIGSYGPLSKQLDKGLRALNKVGAITGYYSIDGNIGVSSPAYAKACEYSDKNAKLSATVEKLSRLVDGFESPLGMELLSTTHFIHWDSGYVEVNDINAQLSKLPEKHRNEFDYKSVESAVVRLSEDGLLF